MVIPAYGESKYLPHTLTSLDANDFSLLKSTLVIVVVNNSIDTNIFLKNDNEKSANVRRNKPGRISAENL